MVDYIPIKNLAFLFKKDLIFTQLVSSEAFLDCLHRDSLKSYKRKECWKYRLCKEVEDLRGQHFFPMPNCDPVHPKDLPMPKVTPHASTLSSTLLTHPFYRCA